MILYKYLSHKSFVEFYLENLKKGECPSLYFSHPNYFNDPFEFAPISNYILLRNGHAPPSRAEAQLALREFSVLSLTSNHLNKLMWSHYGDSYNGFVIGIDIELMDFNNEEKFIIPAKFGRVVYLSEPPKLSFNFEAIKNPSSEFDPKAYDMYQQLFLCKDVCWHYEEEVRIVAKTNRIRSFDSAKQIQHTGTTIPLPIAAIKEIYYSGINRNSDTPKEIYDLRAQKNILDHVKIFSVLDKPYTYEIYAEPAPNEWRARAGLVFANRQTTTKK